MSTQKALLLTAKNGDWVVGDVPIPTPGPKDVLIKIMAAGLNPVDWKNREGEFFTPSYPFVAGMDGAGVVVEAGAEVDNLVKGDRVLFQGDFNNEHGTFQQFCICPAEITAKIPENISFDEAASIPLALGTALTGLWNHDPASNTLNLPAPWEEGSAAQHAGKPIFIIGGATSVGQFAIQMSKLAGCNPIVTTASPHNAPALHALGATHVLDRALAPAATLAALHALSPAVGLALDTVSLPETQALVRAALAPGGALLLVLPAAEAAEGLRVCTVYGVVHATENRAFGAQLFSRVEGWLRDGVLVPNKVEVLSGGLAGVAEGLERMKANRVSGTKLVVRPWETI